MNKALISASALVAMAGVATAQLVEDANIGTLNLGDSINITGDTTGAPNNAISYSPATTFGYDLGERVFGFSLASGGFLNIVNNEGIFVGSDHDHLLLDGLSVDGAGNANNALGFVDEQDSFGFVPAGNYWLSIDTFTFSFEGTFDINLELGAPPPPPATNVDLGAVADVNDVFDIDVFGSDFDTEIGLFDSLGNLLGNNDDSGGLQSALLGNQLAEGTYYLAVGGFNTLFSDGFAVGGGANAGNIAGQVNGTAFQGAINPDEVFWVSFEVVPTPGAASLLALAGFAGLRRRRA